MYFESGLGLLEPEIHKAPLVLGSEVGKFAKIISEPDEIKEPDAINEPVTTKDPEWVISPMRVDEPVNNKDPVTVKLPEDISDPVTEWDPVKYWKFPSNSAIVSADPFTDL